MTLKALSEQDIYELYTAGFLVDEKKRLTEDFPFEALKGQKDKLGKFHDDICNSYNLANRSSRYAIAPISGAATLEELNQRISKLPGTPNHFDDPGRNHWSHTVVGSSGIRPSILFSKIERRQIKVKVAAPDDNSESRFFFEDVDWLFRAELSIEITPKGRLFLLIQFPTFVQKISKNYSYLSEIEHISNWFVETFKELNLAVSPLDLKSFYAYLPARQEGLRKNIFKAEGLTTGKSVISSAFQLGNDEGGGLSDLCDELDYIMVGLIEGWFADAVARLPSPLTLSEEAFDAILSLMPVSSEEMFDLFQKRHKHGFGKVTIDSGAKSVQYSLYYDKETTGIIRTSVGRHRFEPLLAKIKDFLDI